MSLTFGSLFAGVGGFDTGLEQAGWKSCWQVEWDKKCQEVLSYRWPDIKKYLDVQDVNGADIEPVDLITFGSPCQDLSVAGKRSGLDGSRSSMFFEAIRIIKEMRSATSGQYPRIAIWENVPGSLTSNKGNDFARVIDEMADIGALAIEWHVLDAQWFGVPQRRRRVFVTAIFDPAIARKSGGQIFPISEDSAGNIKKIRRQRRKDAQSVENRSGEDIAFIKTIRSGARDAQGNLPPEVWSKDLTSPTLNAFDNNSESRSTVLILDGTRVNDVRVYNESITPTLISRMGTGGNNVPMVAKNESDINCMSIRRLTPIECERLMGFPDNHTKYGDDGKIITDGHRYKMLGNAVAVPVAKWIGEQLVKIC